MVFGLRSPRSPSEGVFYGAGKEVELRQSCYSQGSLFRSDLSGVYATWGLPEKGVSLVTPYWGSRQLRCSSLLDGPFGLILFHWR